MRVISVPGLAEEIRRPSKLPATQSPELERKVRLRLTLHIGIGVRISYQVGDETIESRLSLVLLKIERNTELVPLPQHVDVGEGVVEGEVMNVLDLNLQEVLTGPA